MEREDFGRSLLAAFAAVPDPRSRHGRRHPLPALLALATAAMLCGARSTTPCVATLHLVFKELDVVAFEATLRAWAQGQFGESKEAIAIDGKGLRGIHGEDIPGVRLVAAYTDKAGLVLAQKGGKEG